MDMCDENIHLSSADVSHRAEVGLDVDDVKQQQSEDEYRTKFKYGKELRHLIPLRKTKKDMFPLENSGLFSYMTYNWMSSFVWRVYKNGKVDLDTIWQCPKVDGAKHNSERFERLWRAEVEYVGLEKASMMAVLWRFARTRIIVSAIVQIFTLTLGFIAPAFLVKSLLEYNQNTLDTRLWNGLVIASGFFVCEFFKCVFFVTQWLINYQTAMRMNNGVLTLLYKKILKLRCLKGDQSIGQVVNMFTNDGQRLIEAMSIGPLVIGGPLVATATTIYCCIILSPWALIGAAIFALFYPYQLFISRLTAYLRRKGIVITDRRIRMMNEILTSIKLIKLNAWEKSFADKIAGIRDEERRMLEKAAYVNTLSVAFTPMVPMFAAVFTFIAHTLAGNDLSAPQAFTVLSVYMMVRNSIGIVPFIVSIGSMAVVGVKRMKAFSVIACYYMLRSRVLEPLSSTVKHVTNTMVGAKRFKAFSIIACFHMMKNRVIGPLSGTIKALSELVIGSERFKALLVMEERQPINTQVIDSNNAIEITNGCFAWDIPPTATKSDGNSNESSSAKKDKSSKKSSKNSQDKKTNSSRPKSDDDKNNGENDAEKELLQKESEEVTEGTEYVQILHDINLKVPKGSMYGVCGAVGSGKSSLISAILNQTITVSGSVAVSGNMTYVPQQAWIMNETLRENIIFGQEFDEERYMSVLEQCNLIPDLDMLPGGDMTEIGERGINLSGGQKQRVSLARAVYADKAVCLLDDPLSAVDPHVGQHLFDECLTGALAGKTRLFVTHQLQYLNQCDYIVLIKDGRIHEEGTHTQLMGREGGEYANLINTFHSQHAKDRDNTQPNNPITAESRNPSGLTRVQTADILNRKASMNPEISKLMKTEEIEEGAVSASSYIVYAKAGGGVLVTGLVLLTFTLPVGCAAFSNWWLSYWISQGSGNTTIVNEHNETVISDAISDNPDLYFYELIYGITVIGVVLTMCLRGFFFMKITLIASTRLHDGVFINILRSTMAFFDTTPVGRILNRFSKDLDEIDTKLPLRSEIFLQNAFLMITSLTVISVVFPWFLIALVPIAAVFVFLYVIFRVSLRETKRAENVTRSPWISHIATTLQGMQTLSAYNKGPDFTYRYCELQDKASMLLFLFYYSMRWLSVRLDVITILITTLTAVFIVVFKGSIPTAYAGLALAYAAQAAGVFQVTMRIACQIEASFTSVARLHDYSHMTGMFQFTIRLACEVEATFTSVERIQYFIKNVETESAAVIEDNRPEENWPDKGIITFRDYHMRYRSGLPLVLKGVDCVINAKEKVGIVGRTGSGKSSLGVSLFRLVEPSSGSINIDGLDVTQIGLDDLRSRLSIIPQDPSLFIGTVRYNLDPFDQHCDSDLWQALEKCHVKDVIDNLEGSLSAPVVENGDNFSVGERQLICMARAFLRHSKILMLDEATAAIDTETDSKIQTTIKEAFTDCTMLTIAHRLNTVLTCDRILVMEEGKIVEFEKPSKLLCDPQSRFYSMMSASDMSSVKKLL